MTSAFLNKGPALDIMWLAKGYSWDLSSVSEDMWCVHMMKWHNTCVCASVCIINRKRLPIRASFWSSSYFSTPQPAGHFRMSGGNVGEVELKCSEIVTKNTKNVVRWLVSQSKTHEWSFLVNCFSSQLVHGCFWGFCILLSLDVNFCKLF